MFVYGLGRDAWSARRQSRLWRQAWYESDDAQFGSDRRQQIEHESLAMLLASKRGVSVPDVVTVGVTRTGDALLVTELADHSLANTTADEVDDDLLDAAWKLLGDLHDAGISHGSLDDIHIWVNASGALQLMGFSDAAINPNDDQINQDVAAMLVLTTTGAGPDRAIAAARRARGDDDLAAMLPVLQTAALNARRERVPTAHHIVDLGRGGRWRIELFARPSSSGCCRPRSLRCSTLLPFTWAPARQWEQPSRGSRADPRRRPLATRAVALAAFPEVRAIEALAFSASPLIEQFASCYLRFNSDP